MLPECSTAVRQSVFELMSILFLSLSDSLIAYLKMEYLQY